MDVLINPEAEVLLRGLTKPMVQRIADLTADRAQTLAPVDTGELRDSITTQDIPNGVRVLAAAPYAAFVELGHLIVAWGHNTGRYQRPQPFLIPALLSAAVEVRS